MATDRTNGGGGTAIQRVSANVASFPQPEKKESEWINENPTMHTYSAHIRRIESRPCKALLKDSSGLKAGEQWMNKKEGQL
ncbi:MAG: hypothetical protein NT031_17200 [Planctomycetota bacterium]|nr:hypothetical protein [Planctomycetota bacterium]